MSTSASKKFVSRRVQLSRQQGSKPTTQRKCPCPNGLGQAGEQGFECTNISPTLVLYTQILNNELLGLSKDKPTSSHYYMIADEFGKRKITEFRNNDMTLCSNNLGRTRHARQKLHQKIYRWFEHLSDHPRIQTDNQHNNPYPGPLARYRRSHARNEAGPYLAAV